MHSLKNLIILVGALILGQLSSVCVFGQGTETALRPGDSIVLKIAGVPADQIAMISNTYEISESGTINLAFIGQVRASGVRPSTLQLNIQSAYKNAEIFTNPTIQVSINREANTQRVYVSGEVKAPGAVPFNPSMTVHDAITTAGGPTDFAKMKAVKLIRGGTSHTLDLRRADNPDALMPAMPNDRITITQ